VARDLPNRREGGWCLAATRPRGLASGYRIPVRRTGPTGRLCRPIVLAVTGALALILIGGCGSDGRTSARPATSTTPGQGFFLAAKVAWQQGASADSADQGRYLERAASDLAKAAGTGSTNALRYQAGERELRQMAALPAADQTLSQNATFQRDATALNILFGTGRLYQ
jgi:hypothetical protein